MKKLYASSYPFWVTARIGFIIVGMASLWRIYLHFTSFIDLDMLYLLYLIIMSIIFYGEITKSEPKMFLKYCAGTASIGMGIYLTYLQYIEPEDPWVAWRQLFDYKRFLIYLVGLVLILLGIFDFFKFNTDTEN